MATLYADAVKLIDIRDLGVEIGFGEEGLNGIAITVDGALDKTVGELAPAAQASELPTEIASQKIDLDVKVGLSFDIAYGEEVTLPTDLDTYVEATAPVKPATSSTSDRLFPELYQAILGFEDPEYTKLDVYVPDESDEPVFAYSYNANSPMWEYVASDFQFMLNTGTYPLIEKSVRSGMDVEVSIDKTAIVIELHNEGKDDKGAFQGTNILSYDPVTGYVQAAETSYLYETGENEVTNYSFVWGFVD